MYVGGKGRWLFLQGVIAILQGYSDPWFSFIYVWQTNLIWPESFQCAV